MNPPICSVHQTPMKPSKFGGWNCTRIVGQKPDGGNAYCNQKVKDQPAPPPTQSVEQAGAFHKPPSADMVMESFQMASRVLQGSVASIVDLSAYALAIRNAIRAEQG